MTARRFVWRRLGQSDAPSADVPALEADVLVPLAQGTVTGITAGAALAVMIARLVGLSFLDVAIVAVPVCVALGWAWRLGIVTETLHRIETYAGVDLNGDGRVGDPPRDEHLAAVNPVQAREEVASATRQTARKERLTWLVAFVQRCYAVGTSESAQGAKPGERSQYLEARDLLLRLGLAQWRDEGNKRLGWQMTTDQARAIKVVREHVTTV